MKDPFKNLTPRRKFVWLQILLLILGFVLPIVLPAFTLLVWSPAIGFAGLVLGGVAFAESVRGGLGPLRFVVASALAFLASLVFWKTLLVAISALQHYVLEVSWLQYFAGIEYSGLPVFTTGCLAYFGLGPFRSRPSEDAAATSR